MPTLQQLQTALKDTPNLSQQAKDTAAELALRLVNGIQSHMETDKTTLGELARAMQVETTDNGRTFSLTIENGAHRVILQTPVNSNFQTFEK